MKTYYPKRDDRLLINPGKGYVLFSSTEQKVPQEYAKYQPLQDQCLDIISCFSVKPSWAALQPDSEDHFSWESIDHKLELAQRLGKRIFLGIGQVVGTGGITNGVRSLVPQWVYDAGAKYNDIKGPNYLLPGSEVNRIPEWNDPIYREKFENFIAAVAQRYDGHPLIEAVVNHSQGNWGEWHHLDINHLPGSKETLYIDFRGKVLDLEYFKYYVDLFPKYFKKSRLAMPVNCFEQGEELEPWAKYAADTYNYGFKREGLLAIPDASYSMRYCGGKAPAYGEWQSSYSNFASKGWWSDEVIDREVVDGRLSHLRLGYSRMGQCEYLAEKPEQVAYWANHCGYYYTITRCVYEGQQLHITIHNDGVCPTYLIPKAELALVQQGQAVAVWTDESIRLQDILEKTEQTFTILLPDDMPPDAHLGIRFFSEEGEVLLAHEKDASGYYLLQDHGEVRVHFDHRPRLLNALKGEYLGVDFGDQAWHTVLRREYYQTCLFPDNFLPDHTMELTFPHGATLKSITAFGEGFLEITDESQHTVRLEMSRAAQTFATGFTLPSGKVKVRYLSPYACWSIQITEMVYAH